MTAIRPAVVARTLPKLAPAATVADFAKTVAGKKYLANTFTEASRVYTNLFDPDRPIAQRAKPTHLNGLPAWQWETSPMAERTLVYLKGNQIFIKQPDAKLRSVKVDGFSAKHPAYLRYQLLHLLNNDFQIGSGAGAGDKRVDAYAQSTAGRAFIDATLKKLSAAYTDAHDPDRPNLNRAKQIKLPNGKIGWEWTSSPMAERTTISVSGGYVHLTDGAGSRKVPVWSFDGKDTRYLESALYKGVLS